MKTVYIVDTSVLLADPKFFNHFPDSELVLPIAVLEELDKLKKGFNDVARNARAVIRMLDEVSSLGDITTGIKLDNEALLKVDATYDDLSQFKSSGFGDPHILACAARLSVEYDVTLLSNDFNLRVQARSRGIDAQEHLESSISSSDVYSGLSVFESEGLVSSLNLAAQIASSVSTEDLFEYPLPKLHENEFLHVQGKESMLARYTDKRGLTPIRKASPYNISPRNKEQACAIDLIMDRNVDLVTLIGAAGSGKSLIALAAALEMVINKKQFERLIIYRPIQPVGNDIGYVPGTVAEKLEPWFGAIMDSFEILLTNKNGNYRHTLEMLQDKGRIEMEALTYIRGRSIPNAIILVDEAQNLPPDQIKTILTRAGEGSKIILTGDIDQIDHRDLDVTNNGLIYVIDKFKDSSLSGHITLTKGERSRLATEAAKIL